MKVKGRLRIRQETVVCFLFALLIPFLFLSHTGAGASMIMENRSLKRAMDPVVLKGQELPILTGKYIENIRVYSFKEGDFQPIPFQVDERNKEDKYCYRQGENPIKDEDSNFDANDECVLMAMDTGDRVNPKQYVSGGVDTIYEVEIVDPVNAKKGWVYAVYYNSNPPKMSDRDYCQTIHIPGKGGHDIVETPWFRWYYEEGHGFPREVSVPEMAGGNGEDFFDVQKFRVSVSFLFKSVKLRLNERNISSITDAYSDGPVRVIRKSGYRLKIGFGLKTPAVYIDYVYYPHWADCPANINIPVSPKHLCSQLIVDVGTDYSPAVIGCKSYNSENLKGVLIDGKMSPEELNWNTAGDKWRVMTGPVGAFFSRAVFVRDVEIENNVHITVLYRDDASYNDPPEDHPGELGHMYQRIDVTNAKAGRFNAHWDYYFPPHFQYPKDVNKVLQIRDNPIRMHVTKVMD